MSLERISTDSAGREANERSYDPTISANGRYVAFTSGASNLVAGDSNGQPDIFVKDLATGTTTRVNTDSDGRQANGYSFYPSVSADGRYVAFTSQASNLVAGDTNNAGDIFVKDLATGVTTRVNTDSAGHQANGYTGVASISADGRYVAFQSQATNLVPYDNNRAGGVFVKELATGITTRVDTDSSGLAGNFSSDSAAISADGRYVAFVSSASNLVAGDTNNASDVFVKDLATGAIERVSANSAGQQANDRSEIGVSISADGRYVAFTSGASNLVAGDSNNALDVFVKDRATGETTRVSTDSAGHQVFPGSGGPTISADGRFVAFVSAATNLVAGDTNSRWDVFVKDLATGEITRIATENYDFYISDSPSASISADGHRVAFKSWSTNLVAGDTNSRADVFIADLPTLPDPTFDADGADRMIGGAAHDWLIAKAGDDTLIAGAGNDRIDGNAGNDLLFGNGGHDSLSGGEGNDTLHGGDGDDTLDGGAGHDAAAFGTAAQGVSVDLATGSATGAGGDRLIGIEEVFGSRFDDDIRGDAGNNWFTGGAGDDTLDGRGGRDTASYADAAGSITVDLAAGTADGRGHDRLISIENVVGSRFDDVIGGDAGDNWLTGGQGDDTLVGRDGRDIAAYGDATGGVIVDLALGTATGHGNDRLIGIENIVGGRFADVLGGDWGNNFFAGGQGDDTLIGGHGQDSLLGEAGDDRLEGSEGSDWLLGGAGADTFSFAPWALAASEVDHIADFTRGEDRLDLQAFGFAAAADVLALATTDGTDSVLDLRSVGGPQLVLDHPIWLHAADLLI